MRVVALPEMGTSVPPSGAPPFGPSAEPEVKNTETS